MRLIDADALLDEGIRVEYGYNDNGLILIPMRDVRNSIKNAPTVDAVAVVRCKDCKKRNTPDCLMWLQCDCCGSQWSWEYDNGYCSAGERSENEL